MCKMKKKKILLASLLIGIALLVVLNIYFFIKYRAKQKHLLPFHDASIKEIDIKNIFKKMKSNQLKEIDTKNRTC